MRDVTDARKAAYVKATTRVINLATVKKSDLMLCVREEQVAIARHIVESFRLGDVVEVNGQEEYFTVKVGKEEKTYNSKLWNPVTWAFFLRKPDFLHLFYDTLHLHLTHCLDVNPGKFDVEASDEEVWGNKGRLQGLLFTVYNRDYDLFLFGVSFSHRYLSGSAIYALFRAFVDTHWQEGLSRFLLEPLVHKVLRGMPRPNRRGLLGNMRGYGTGGRMGEWVGRVLDEIEGNIERDEGKYGEKAREWTQYIFEKVMEDDVEGVREFVRRHGGEAMEE